MPPRFVFSFKYHETPSGGASFGSAPTDPRAIAASTREYATHVASIEAEGLHAAEDVAVELALRDRIIKALCADIRAILVDRHTTEETFALLERMISVEEGLF